MFDWSTILSTRYAIRWVSEHAKKKLSTWMTKGWLFFIFFPVNLEYEIRTLNQEAQTRWLKPPEVYFILKNHERYELTHKAPHKPTSKFDFGFSFEIKRKYFFFFNFNHESAFTQVDHCVYTIKGFLNSSVKMVIIGGKRGMVELLLKLMNVSRFVLLSKICSFCNLRYGLLRLLMTHRWVTLRLWIVIMHMESMTLLFRGVSSGCLICESFIL